jgi:PIN domain nuclease of toxin-antitoxin system
VGRRAERWVEMKLLLDTVTFLHAVLDPSELSSHASDLLLDPRNERYLSSISVWEIAIKYSLGKIELAERPDRFVPKHRALLGAAVLTLEEESALHVTRLPEIHRDPFDRILICQAIVHGMVLLTPDEQISRYPVRTAW